MPTDVGLDEEDIARLLDRLPVESSLFRDVDRTELGDLLRLAGHRLRVAPGECLIREGDVADAIYFIESGRFEVLKQSDQGSDQHVIGETLPGAVVGEVALLDRGRRSASIRATEDSTALMLRVGDLQRAAGERLHPAVQMQLNLAQQIAQRVRNTTSSTVRHLEDSLLEAQKRVEMGRFMSRVLIGTCIYMFALVLIEPLKQLVPDSTVISVAILLGFAAGLYLNIRTSMFPISAYGFTLFNWKAAIAEATLFSLPILALIVLLKWVFIQSSPQFAHHALFDFYRHGGLDAATVLGVIGAYALFVPVQEMVARSGIQSSLMMFLRPRHRVAMSIFMSTLLFSSTHLHTNFWFAVVVFPFGLFWGWLYSRHPTLIGVTFSHLLIGIWGIFIVSFPFL